MKRRGTFFWVCVIVGLAVLLSLAACGGSGTGDDYSTDVRDSSDSGQLSRNLDTFCDHGHRVYFADDSSGLALHVIENDTSCGGAQ